MSVNNNDFAIELMRSSYAAYCYFVHKEKWIDTKFHRFLADKVQTFVETVTGNPYDILVLSTPPQHGKSMTVTETFPSWYVGKHPDRRCIVACYNDDFAGRFGRRNKNKIEEYGQFIFDIALSKSSDRDIEIANHSGSILILIENHDVRIENSSPGVKRMMTRTGAQLFEKLLILQEADNLAKNEKFFKDKKRRLDETAEIYKRILSEHQPYTISELTVNGKDLIKIGYKPGRILGDCLKKLLDEVIINPELNRREYLLARAKELKKTKM